MNYFFFTLIWTFCLHKGHVCELFWTDIFSHRLMQGSWKTCLHSSCLHGTSLFTCRHMEHVSFSSNGFSTFLATIFKDGIGVKPLNNIFCWLSNSTRYRIRLCSRTLFLWISSTNWNRCTAWACSASSIFFWKTILSVREKVLFSWFKILTR